MAPVPPVTLLKDVNNSFELLLTNFEGLPRLALVKGLANAKNYFEARVKSCTRLGRDERRSFVE